MRARKAAALAALPCESLWLCVGRVGGQTHSSSSWLVNDGWEAAKGGADAMTIRNRSLALTNSSLSPHTNAFRTTAGPRRTVTMRRMPWGLCCAVS